MSAAGKIALGRANSGPKRRPRINLTAMGNGWADGFSRATRSLVRYAARKLPYESPPFWKGQFIGVFCAVAGAGTRLALTPIVHNQLPVVVFYPFILMASVWGGTLSGLSALVISAMIADYLWLAPAGHILTLTAFSIACLAVIIMAHLFRALVALHVEDEGRAVLLAHEMKHRTNNLFGVVQAISAQTARSAYSVEEHQAMFSARLLALARAQQLVSDNPDAQPDLRLFLLHIVEPFGVGRFMIDGPRVAVPHYLGTSCALLLHELSTNAMKYGALSVPDGMVTITWERDANRVRLDWQELNGPAVAEPVRTGFGSRLLKTAFPTEYGEASITYNPDGVHCTVSFMIG